MGCGHSTPPEPEQQPPPMARYEQPRATIAQVVANDRKGIEPYPQSEDQLNPQPEGQPDATTLRNIAIAADRASTLEARMEKRRPKPKDKEKAKDAHWKKYNELDRAVDPARAGPSASASSSSASPRNQLDGASSPTASATPSSSVTSSSHQSPSAGTYAIIPTATIATPAQSPTEDRLNVFDQIEQRLQEREKSTANIESANSATTTLATANILSSLQHEYAASMQPPQSASTPRPIAASSSPSSQLQPQSSFLRNAYFEAQMLHLFAKVKVMPQSAISLLRKILANLLKAGETPSEADQKFRRVKLSNPKIQESIVKVDGAVELLMACGFIEKLLLSQAEFGAQEPFLVFEDKTPLESVWEGGGRGAVRQHNDIEEGIVQYVYKSLGLFETPAAIANSSSPSTFDHVQDLVRCEA